MAGVDCPLLAQKLAHAASLIVGVLVIEPGNKRLLRRSERGNRIPLHMSDFHGVREIGPVVHLDGDDAFSLGHGARPEVRAQFHQKQAWLAWLRQAVGHLGEPPHLLQQLHYFYSGSHSLNPASVFAVHVPAARRAQIPLGSPRWF
jgi:hypothetical protein